MTGEHAMTATPGKPQESAEEYTHNSPEAIPSGTIYSYNLDDSKTPGGIKVRWKVRVVTGPQAARYDTRQAEAIKEALTWALRHQDQLRSHPGTP
jgi:hypothetical protein